MFQGKEEEQEVKVSQSKGRKMPKPCSGLRLIRALFFFLFSFSFFRSEAVRDDSGSVHE